MKNKITILVLGVLFFNTINAQISTGAGGAASILPNSTTTNTNVGIGTNNPKAKLEIEGFPTTNTTYIHDNVSKEYFEKRGRVKDGSSLWIKHR